MEWPILFLIHMFTALKRSQFISFVITEAGVVPCGGP